MELKKKIVLALYLLALVLYRLYGYSGHFGYDDMEYAEMSYRLLTGDADYSNHFTYRFSIIIPTAISYFFFGINDWSSSIPPMIASGFVLLLVFRLLKKESIATISIALTMTLFSEWFLFYGNKLMVDIYVCLGVLGVIFSLHQIRFYNPKQTTKYALLFALSLLFSFMAKGTVILIFPVLLFLFIRDITQKQHQRFWEKAIVFSSFLLVVYLLLMHFLTGDFTSRFTAIESNGYINKCSYVAQETTVVLKRITRDFFEMLRNEGPAWGFIFILVALLFSKKISFFKLKTPLSFFLTCSFVLLLSSNFMSISLSGYNPMCIDLRHYLWLVPLSGIATGLLIQETSSHKRFQLIVLVMLGFLCLNTFLNESKLLWKLYLPLSGLYLTYVFINNKVFRKSIFPALFALVFMIQPFYISSNARDAKYNKQVKVIQELLTSIDQETIIFTDIVQARIGNYLAEFDTSKVKFIDFENINSYYNSSKAKKILLNPYTHYFAGVSYENYPFFVKHEMDINSPNVHDQETGIRIYLLNKLVEPTLTGKVIINDSLNFESKVPSWNINTNNITDSIATSGRYAEKLTEFSSTFKLPLDELSLDSTKSLYFNVAANTLIKEVSSSMLVISIGDQESNYFWKGFNIEPFQRVYSNWWLVKQYTTLPVSSLKPNSTLSFYLWNKDKEEIWLDDMHILIYEY